MTPVVFFLIAQAGAATAVQPLPPPVPIPPPVTQIPSPVPPSPARRSGRAAPAAPAGNPGEWASSDDYPEDALVEEQEGVVRFRVDIDLQGKVTHCAVVESSNSEALDAKTCELILERGQFTPALDKRGKPTRGSWTGSIRWQIPEGEPTDDPLVDADGRPHPTTISEIFFVEPDGSTSNCKTLVDGNDVHAKPATSGPCSSKRRYTPFTDESGRPVRKRVVVTMSITVLDAPPEK